MTILDRIFSELLDMMTQAHKRKTDSKTEHDKAVAHGRFMAICEVQDMIREIFEADFEEEAEEAEQ